MDAKELATTYFNESVLTQMERIAQTFIKSGACPKYIQNAPQLVLTMQTGYEMGMKPVEAMNSLYIVNGAINLWGKALARRLREHGWIIKYEMLTDRGGSCRATVTKGDESYTETYSFEAAEKSGYTKDFKGNVKIGWKEGVNRMLKLRYGALSVIIKSYIPEVMGAASEVQEVYEDAVIETVEPEEGEVVDNKPKTTKVMNDKRPSIDEFLQAKEEEKKKNAEKVAKSEPKAKETAQKEEKVSENLTKDVKKEEITEEK